MEPDAGGGVGGTVGMSPDDSALEDNAFEDSALDDIAFVVEESAE